MCRLKFILFIVLIAFVATPGMAMEDARETLLKRAKTLSIKSPAEDGSTVDSMLAELERANDNITEEKRILGRVDSLKFGKDQKTLAQKVQDRLDKHDSGVYKDFGLKGKEKAIGAFHGALQAAKQKGASSAGLVDEVVAAKKFTAGVRELYTDGVLEGYDISQVEDDPVTNLPNLLEHLQGLGIKISDLEGEVARLEQEEAKKAKEKLSKSTIPVLFEDDTGMPLFSL